MKDEADFVSINPAVTNRVGSFSWGIGNGGDEITLRDFWNDKVLSVDFDNEAPWPTAPDGNSQTLEKWDWATNLNDPESWHEGCPGGSPGRAFTYCVYTDIVEENAEKQISMYPNPASDMVWVELEQRSMLSVFNVTGQKLMEQELSAGKNSISTSHLSTGVYIVVISSQDQPQYVQRLVIN